MLWLLTILSIFFLALVMFSIYVVEPLKTKIINRQPLFKKEEKFTHGDDW